MSDAAHLWLYFAVVFGVVVLPGLDMAFVLASSLTGGRRAGMAAVAGIVAGGVCHMVMASLGLAVVLRVAPRAFNALLLAGTLYVAWIGVSLWRGGASLGNTSGTVPRSGLATFRQGALTSLLNPKAYVFMLAIFPQFVRPERGPIWEQTFVLWLITAATQIGVYGVLGLVAARVRACLAATPSAGAAAGRAVGALLVLAAVFTGWEGWRAG